MVGSQASGESAGQPFRDSESEGWRVLREAATLITEDRRQDYGSVDESFAQVAVGWEVILGAPVRPDQVALCMVWLKMARQVHKHKRDNLVDMAGYTGLAAQLVFEELARDEAYRMGG